LRAYRNGHARDPSAPTWRILWLSRTSLQNFRIGSKITIWRAIIATDGADGYLWDASLGGGKGLVPTLLLTTDRPQIREEP
jgi:hypothetical protein